jgi:hypothetical protein
MELRAELGKSTSTSSFSLAPITIFAPAVIAAALLIIVMKQAYFNAD